MCFIGNFQNCLLSNEFHLIMLVACSFMPNIFNMAIPDNSSKKGALYHNHLLCFGAISTAVTGENGMDLLRKLKKNFHSHDQIYIVKNFGYQSKNFKSMSVYVYNYWDFEKYTDILSISHLNSLSVGREFW